MQVHHIKIYFLLAEGERDGGKKEGEQESKTPNGTKASMCDALRKKSERSGGGGGELLHCSGRLVLSTVPFEVHTESGHCHFLSAAQALSGNALATSLDP
jgi:hypothetical protein